MDNNERPIVKLDYMEVCPTVRFSLRTADIPSLIKFANKVAYITVTCIFRNAKEEDRKFSDTYCYVYISLENSMDLGCLMGTPVDASAFPNPERCAVSTFDEKCLGSLLLPDMVEELLNK